MEMGPFETAMYYRFKLGWNTVPVLRGEKYTYVKWEFYEQNYVTEKDIIQWFKGKTWEQVGIAIVTGAISNLVVIDVDDPSGDTRGFSSPLTVRTGRGGTHLYYKWYKRTTTRAGKVPNMPKVDVRGDEGLIMAPPSYHPDGPKYEWMDFTEPTPELLEKLPVPPEIVYVGANVLASIDVSDFKNAPKGTRNDMCYTICNVCLKVAKSEQAAYEAAWDMVSRWEEPLSQKEFETTFKSCVKHQKAPRLGVEDAGMQEDEVPEIRTLSSAAEGAWKMLENERNAPSTGYPELDKALSGIVRGNLYTFTAETNMGKTMFSANIAYNLAKQEKKVLYIALETGDKIGNYLAQIKHQVERKDLTLALLKDQNDNISILTGKECRSAAVLDKILKKYTDKFDLIIVDHIGYFITESKDVIQKQQNMLQEFAGLARDRNTAIWLVAHPRKTDGRPTSMQDIAGSAGFYQNSTDVLILRREYKDAEEPDGGFKKQGKIVVAKTKSARDDTTVCYVEFDTPKATIYPMGQQKYTGPFIIAEPTLEEMYKPTFDLPV